MITARNTQGYMGLLAAVSIVALIGITTPSQAGSLGGVVGGAVGAVGNTVGNTVGSGTGTGGLVGGVANTVSGTVDGLSGTPNKTTSTAGIFSSNSVTSDKSSLIGGIKASLSVLSKKQLVKLCVGIGGGTGCGSGHSRHQLLGLIDARLNLLSKKQLLGLCVSVGGSGCGGGGYHGAGVALANIHVLDRKGVLHGNAKSDLIGGIKAKLDVLSKKNLAKLCVGIGGGSGCGSGYSRHQLLGLIDYRLTLLSKKQLLGLCVSVGGTGCGSKMADGGGGGGGNGGNGGNGGGGNGGNGGGNDVIGQEVASLTSGERRELKRKCPGVLQNPTSYSTDAVRVCRVLGQIAGF